MIANAACTEAITQRPAIRWLTSRSASRPDSRSKRSASSPRAAHRLPQQDAGHRQRLLDQDRDVGHRPLAMGGDALALAADAPRQGDEDRQQRERERRQAPVEQEHGHDRGDDRGQVGDDRGRGGRHDVLHAADVVGDPRLDLARPRAREEGERQALEVPVDRRAQVVHDALPDEVREPRLRHAQSAGDHGDADHAGDQRRQQRRVALRDRLVEHRAKQERRCHAQPGGEQDQREHRREPPPVGTEEANDPACVGLQHLVEGINYSSAGAAHLDQRPGRARGRDRGGLGPPRLLSGLIEEDGRRLFVTRGVGTTGIPARLFAPAEIALLELVPL